MLRINPINTFDASFDCKIDVVSDYASGYFVIYIVDAIVGDMFYSTVVEVSKVITIKKNTLNNGRKYTVYVEHKKDATSLLTSERSNYIYFKCFSIPQFRFIPVKNPIKTNTMTLQIEYKQKENDKLTGYRFVCYEAGTDRIKSDSGWQSTANNPYSHDGLLTYTLVGLQDGKYYADVHGVTAGGMECKTDRVELFVSNNNPNTTYDILELENNICDGYVSYKTNIIIILPNDERSSLDYNYINGCVDLRNGKYLCYDKNIKLDNNFSLALFCKDLDKDATYFVALNNDRPVFKISSYYYPHKNIYKIILTTMSGDLEIEHYSQDLNGKNVKIIVNKMNELYQLNVMEG